MKEHIGTLTPHLEWLGVLSALTFAISLFIIPWLIKRLPEDYFLFLYKSQSCSQPGTKSFVLLFFKNLLGLVLLGAGFLMLFIPGQGLLTMLMGVLCMSFPGKHKLVLYMVEKNSIKTSLNWVRKKMSRPLFLWR